MKQKKGWFRYGVSSKERLENLKKAVKHGKPIVVGFDTEYFSMHFKDGDALPVWISKAEAEHAVPKDEFPDLRFVEISKEEFIDAFSHLKMVPGTYVAIRPQNNGKCLSLAMLNFLEDVLETSTK